MSEHPPRLAIKIDIDRHKSAIVRTDLSRPVKLALESNLLNATSSFFDYGCGHGGDVARAASLSASAQGWDPYYCPSHSKVSADVVNLGYVLNVVEDQQERADALKEAWSLTKKVLVVSAQVLLNYLSGEPIAYGDGVITKRNTFQKYFKQEELSTYIESLLKVKPVPAGLGIFFVFKNEAAAEAFKSSRFHSKRSTPIVRLRTRRYEEVEELLEPLITFVSERGRLPLKEELVNAEKVIAEFNSLKAAFNFVQNSTSNQEWNSLIEKCKNDLLVYIALSRFTKRPRIGLLPAVIQQDIKDLFGNYKRACDIADQMLFSLGKEGVVASECRRSQIGKLLPDGLYVHISALADIGPLLRIYEGCASRTIGRMDGATLVKFHTDKPKISYLFYPDFDTDPHPSLHASMRIDLRDLHVSVSNYSDYSNPPILHRKETFVSNTYPLFEQFKKLTEDEVAAGLFSEPRTIGTRQGWQKRLDESNIAIFDHCISDARERSELQSAAVHTHFDSGIRKLETQNEQMSAKELRMSYESLLNFIKTKMSASHVYQPGMIIALLKNDGKTTISKMAESCSEIGKKPSSDYIFQVSKVSADGPNKPWNRRAG